MTCGHSHQRIEGRKSAARTVSRPGDAGEREAHRAADVVAHGGSVTNWSFSALSASDPVSVQREDQPKEKTDDEKYVEALKKTGEAVLATKEGKAVKKKILNEPVVKAATDALESTPGKIVAGAGIVGGVAALAATGKSLPVQPPEMSLDRITPGLSAKVTYEGPVNAPTFVGLTVTYKERGREKRQTPGPDPIATDIARLKAQQEMFRPAAEKAAAQAEEDRMVDAWVASQKLPGGPPGFMIPLTPPTTKRKEAPVQRAPAMESAEAPARAYPDDALASSGRPLDPATRRSMEARFGYDFAGVRIHDNAAATAAAHDTEARAFTVGQDIVFGAGRYEPTTPAGRHLLAHELAHVVQQSRRAGGHGPDVQRRNVFESFGILLGIAEGTWEDRELHEYLDAMMQADQIEGDYDSDNKARAIVSRWKAASPGFDLVAAQKVMLIREMLDGPTLGGDEEAILDLLELSDASDVRVIFGNNGVSLTELESDINGGNRTRLDTFIAGRFVGGRDAVIAGRVVVAGPSLPPGAPHHDFDATTLDARFDSDRTAEELVEIIRLFSSFGRRRALHHLSQVRRPRQMAAVERLVALQSRERDRARIDAVGRLIDGAAAAQLKTERVLLAFLLEAAPATAAELASGTRPADPSRRQELQDALHPPVHQTPTGRPAPFRRRLPGEAIDYDDKVRAALPGIVNETYQQLVAGRGPVEHRTAARVHQLSEFEAIGNISKRETDALFRRYLAHDMPQLTADRPATPGHAAVRGNIHDRFTDAERDVRRDPSLKRKFARDLIIYFYQSDGTIRRLNSDHDATPDFQGNDFIPNNPEAVLLDQVATQFLGTATNVTRLFEIERNWPAEQNTPDIFIQIFRGATPAEDRLLLWDMFQTLIHEYIHSLRHDDYQIYADQLPEASFNTLIEGVCSLLTEIVWARIEPRVGDHALRVEIEGPTLAAQPAITVPHASQRRYESYTEALRLVDLVGIESLYAAYFLGLIDRIGGTLPVPAPGPGHP